VNDVTGRQLLVVDKNRHVVASSDPARPPLAIVDLPELDQALAGGSGSSTARIDGQARVLTYTPVARAKWVLYVIDDPSVVLALERDLQQNISIGASAALLATLIFAGIIVALFATLARRRDQLARSQLELVTTNAELETANRYKSEFLSSMSHELRTPMNAILGFSDLLDEQLRERITERQRRYFQNIREAGEHLLALINDVLDLSKVESGRVELRPEIVTVQQVLEPVLANARHEAPRRGLHLESSIGDDATVRLDPGRVRQILYNLTSNALKFTPSGGDIAVRSRVDGSDLLFEVSDTGIGIPADRRDRVFGMFERVNEDRSEARGTGLGLALSKRLVELHGGAISFTSGEHGGTTFRVLLPNVVQARNGEATEVRHAPAAR
jgi:signal transduction histidine kinase